MPSLATFNANNFFLRYRFTNTYPGDASHASRIEAGEVGLMGYLPGTAFGNLGSSYIIWDAKRRELAARALAEPDGRLPDILCLQEVENIQAIRKFNQAYLGGHYRYSMLIDAYDPRNIDVGVLSTLPITEIRSHIDEVDDQGRRLFSRDCLEVTVDLGGNQALTVLVNHLKSKFIRRDAGESDEHFNARRLADHLKRRRQAELVRGHLSRRFADQYDTALYAVVGDFNDTPLSPYVKPLAGYGRLTDILARHRPADDCWTYYWRSKNRVSQIDYLLVSKALCERVDQVVAVDPARKPHIERRGLGFRELNADGLILPRRANLVHLEEDPVTPLPADAPAPQPVDFRFERYEEVMSDWKNNISDHCPVKMWF